VGLQRLYDSFVDRESRYPSRQPERRGRRWRPPSSSRQGNDSRTSMEEEGEMELEESDPEEGIALGSLKQRSRENNGYSDREPRENGYSDVDPVFENESSLEEEEGMMDADPSSSRTTTTTEEENA